MTPIPRPAPSSRSGPTGDRVGTPVGPLRDDGAGRGIGVIGNDEVLPAGNLQRPEVDLESQVTTPLGDDDLTLGHPLDRPRPVVTHELGTLRGLGGATPPRDPLALGRPFAHTG